jgi:hypothetical protein
MQWELSWHIGRAQAKWKALKQSTSSELPFNPVDLFDHNLSKQIKEWRGKREKIILMMEINDHPLWNKLYTKLKGQNTEMEGFTHKCWGPKELYMHHLGKPPIDGAYKTPEVEILNLSMVNFAESPGDHWSFVLNILTRSLLGVYRYKVCWPVSQRLVTLQQSSVRRGYNKIIREQFDIHHIKEWMNMVDNMSWYCRYPSPWWLRSMIIKLYKLMMEIRIHTEKNCRKILQLDDIFSRTIQMWYDRIHAYLQLIQMKEGKTNNTRNILRSAHKQHINKPEEWTVEELQDGLQFVGSEKRTSKSRPKDSERSAYKTF